MENSKGPRGVFRIFRNKDSFFEEINKEQSNRLIVNQVLLICAFAFIYGAVMGSYHSFPQSIVAGLKLIALFLSTIIICFPSFFIIQQVLGSGMSMRQMIIIVLSGLVLTSAILASFAPIVIFFQITGGNYHFLQLLHVGVFIFAGIFGLKLMVDALKFACENKAVYPQIGVTVFKIWIIILAFVGIQLAWNLRPFLCEKNEEFKLFRKYEGNFYTAIIYSVEQLAAQKEVKTEEPLKPKVQPADSAVNKLDTSSLIYKVSK